MSEKTLAHDRFVNDDSCLVMCASLRAAGVGLSWTIASLVYHLDLWWNPQALKQAEDRVHRIGQERPVLVKRLVAEETIEQGILRLLKAKEAIFDFVVEGTSLPEPSPTSLQSLLSLIGLKLNSLR